MTLLELVVVMTIVAVVSAAGMLSLSGLLAGKLEAEARMLIADLSWARGRTVATHSDHTVLFDPDHDRYTISGGGQTLKSRSLEVDLTLVTPAGDLTLTAPHGKTQSKQIVLDDRGQTARVTVFGDTGYLKIE